MIIQLLLTAIMVRCHLPISIMRMAPLATLWTSLTMRTASRRATLPVAALRWIRSSAARHPRSI